MSATSEDKQLISSTPSTEAMDKMLNHLCLQPDAFGSLAISLTSAEFSSEDSNAYLESVKADSVAENDDNDNNNDSLKPANCVFVGSLAMNETDEELQTSVKSLFETYGTVAGVRVLRDSLYRPYAFVQYTNLRDCTTAVREGKGQMIGDRRIRVEPAKINRSLFIETKDRTTEADMRLVLLSYGKLEQLETTNSKGDFNSEHRRMRSNFFICRFVFRKDAVKAYVDLKDKSKYTVSWVQNVYGNSHQSSGISSMFDKCSVFISQLPVTVTEDAIRKRFSKYGEIQAVKVFFKEHYAFAFVTFSQVENAIDAVEGENHNSFLGQIIHVQFREVSRKQSFNHFHTINGLALAPAPLSSKFEHGLIRGNSSTQNRHTRGPNFKKSGLYFDYPQANIKGHQAMAYSNWNPELLGVTAGYHFAPNVNRMKVNTSNKKQGSSKHRDPKQEPAKENQVYPYSSRSGNENLGEDRYYYVVPGKDGGRAKNSSHWLNRPRQKQ